MLSVGAAAITTCLLRKRSLTSLGWGRGAWKYQWMGYLLPLGIASLAYLIIWGVGFGGWYNLEFVASLKDSYNLPGWSDTVIIIFHFIVTASVSFILLLPSVLGEEIGWRGFLVPELSKFMSFTGVALVSGFIWSAWHWPLIFAGIYGNDSAPLYYQLGFFTLSIMSASVVMTYLRLKTRSLWPAVIFHMSGNVFMQKAFTPLTAASADSDWYIDEFGAVPALVSFMVAVYFWRKGRNEFRGTQAMSVNHR